jgi:hypothetical protein
MKEIILTKGFVTLVDDTDYDWLNQWKWCVTKCNDYFYAMRNDHYSGKNHYVLMHRLIMNTPKDKECDHVFHNTLDNRRFIEVGGELKPNLRNCTHAQNSMNKLPKGKSKYLGVSYDAQGNVRAFIKKKEYHKNLGIFKTEEDAARAYDNKAKQLFGEFANLNFK